MLKKVVFLFQERIKYVSVIQLNYCWDYDLHTEQSKLPIVFYAYTDRKKFALLGN
jgi:hypothetical protein